MVRLPTFRVFVQAQLKEAPMNTRCLPLALLVVALSVTGCTTYYRITDTSNGRTYYTTDYRREPNNVRFKDAKTGAEMTVPTADVRTIPSEEYNANVGK
jgi:hypothetical protein